MKKRMLSLALAGILAVSCLAGCGSDQGSETTESTTAQGTQETQGGSNETAQTDTQELEPATIQIWLGGPGKQKDSDRIWEQFNEMLQEYVPNTTVEFTVMTTAEYGERFNQMLAAGEAVDLAWVASWVTGAMNDNIRDGNLMALDDLLHQYGQGIKEELGQEVLDMHRYSEDNLLYYLISWQGLYSNVRAIKVPTEFAELAGDTWLEDTQEVVTKWWNDYSSPEDFQAVFDQLDIYFKALQDNDQLYAGMNVGIFTGFCYANHLSSENSLQIRDCNVGVVHNDDTFTVIDAIDTDYYRVFAENMADFYEKGYVRSDIASLETGTLTFITGGEFTPNTTVIDVHNALTSDTAAMYSAQAGVDISLIQIEERGYLSKGDASAVAIPYCADEPERAMMVLDALYTVPELYQLLIYGIEGEHYTDNGDGTITTSYGSQGTSDADYGLWKWTIGTCKNSLVTQADTPGYYDELLAQEETAIVSPFNNFTLDTSSVQDIVAAVQAIDSEYGDMIRKGYLGDQWEATMDQWIAERKAAGVDTLIAEMQRQIDEYVEANQITSWQ